MLLFVFAWRHYEFSMYWILNRAWVYTFVSSQSAQNILYHILACIDICCIHLAVIQYIYYDTLYSKSSHGVQFSWKTYNTGRQKPLRVMLTFAESALYQLNCLSDKGIITLCYLAGAASCTQTMRKWTGKKRLHSLFPWRPPPIGIARVPSQQSKHTKYVLYRRH